MTTRYGRFQCLGLAVALALGAGVAWGFLGVIVFATMETLFAPAGTHWETQDLTILRDGTPLIQSTSYDGDANNITFRTLDGKPYENPFTKLLRSEFKATLSGPFSDEEPLHRMTWPLRVVRVGGTSNGATWYFVTDGLLNGHGYLIGYNNETKLKVGYICRSGFRPDEPPVEDRFPINCRRINFSGGLVFCPSDRIEPERDESLPRGGKRASFLYVVVDDGIVFINLNDRTAKVVLKDSTFISAADLNGRIAVRTPDRIRILQLDGKEIRSYPLPSALHGEGVIELWELPKNEIVLRSYSAGDNLFRLNASGKVVRHEHVPVRTWSQPKWISPTVEKFMGCVIAFPSPGAILTGLGYDSWKRAAPQRFWTLWPEWWPGLLGTAIISVVLAVFCYFHHREYGLPWTWVWTAFVLLFGVPAYLGYLAHRSWPARLACPHCGRRVPRDRPACFACNRDFPPPPPKGIEVFA
jgi:hypothetical protein